MRSSGCSPRNLSVKCSRGSSTHDACGTHCRRTAVAAATSRRTWGVRLMARKSRTLRGLFVHRPGAEPARIELDALIAGRQDNCLEPRAELAVHPAAKLGR